MQLYQHLIDRFIRTRLGGWIIVNVLHGIDRRLMRWSSGRLNTGIGTNYRENLVLLHCTGAKSGKHYEIPLLAAPMGDQFVLTASAGGRERNPAWYHNLKANPDCALLMPGGCRIPCQAHEAQGEERQRAWAAANAEYTGYTSYQGRTERLIPVMILTPIAT